jgi:DNA-binding CsgD family transcriptional regulator
MEKNARVTGVQRLAALSKGTSFKSKKLRQLTPRLIVMEMRLRVKTGARENMSLARPGLIIVDASFAVVAYNREALQILAYPDQPSQIGQVDNWLAHKIRTDLARRQAPPRFVEEFRSARRKYPCRSFLVDLKGEKGNGSASGGGWQIVMLERKSNDAVKLTQISQRFGLTAREGETVRHLLKGFTSKQIAQCMEISPNTVKAFLRLVMVKMDVSTRSGIIGRIIDSSE